MCDPMKRIGFIGLGTMGKPMAFNLLRKGYELTVFNRTSGKMADLASAGAHMAASPAEVAREVDVVMTIVSNDAALLEVTLGDNGIIAGGQPGLIVIDSSTVAPQTSRRVAEALGGQGIAFVDAPVAGSQPAAESGTLVFMAGGEPGLLADLADVFAAMGSRYVHMGPSGSGAYAKLAHNLIVGVNTAALAEGFALAARAGIDADKFLDIVQSGGAASRMAELKGRKIIEQRFEPQFALHLMLKDLQLAAKASADYALPTPLLAAAATLYQIGYASGNGPLDLSAVARSYEGWIGSTIGSTVKAAVQTVDTGEADERASTEKESGWERRRSERVNLGVKLHMSVYQWQAEGAFSGQNYEVTLQDLSGNGLQLISDQRLAEDMFVVIHFPRSASVPPITAKIIRIERESAGTFRYGCMMSGLSPVIQVRLNEYIQDVRDGKEL